MDSDKWLEVQKARTSSNHIRWSLWCSPTQGDHYTVDSFANLPLPGFYINQTGWKDIKHWSVLPTSPPAAQTPRSEHRAEIYAEEGSAPRHNSVGGERLHPPWLLTQSLERCHIYSFMSATQLWGTAKYSPKSNWQEKQHTHFIKSRFSPLQTACALKVFQRNQPKQSMRN